MAAENLTGRDPTDPDTPSIDFQVDPLRGLVEMARIEGRQVSPEIMQSPDYTYLGRVPERPLEHRLAQQRAEVYAALKPGLLSTDEQRELLLAYEEIATRNWRIQWKSLPETGDHFERQQRTDAWKGIFEKVGLGDFWTKINGIGYETARTENFYREASRP